MSTIKIEDIKSLLLNKYFWGIATTLVSITFTVGRCSGIKKHDAHVYLLTKENTELKEGMTDRVLVFDTIQITKLISTNRYYRSYHFDRKCAFNESFVDPYTGASLAILTQLIVKNSSLYSRSSSDSYSKSEYKFIGIVDIPNLDSKLSEPDTIVLGQSWQFKIDTMEFKLVFKGVDCNNKIFNSELIQLK